MKREAVQEERQRAARGAEDAHPSSSVQVSSDTFTARIMVASYGMKREAM